MGKDPKTSVVGIDHRVHGTDNLFVADPSVFPTAPSVDPSLTIMAFSCVAAETREDRAGLTQNRPSVVESFGSTPCLESRERISALSFSSAFCFDS